MNFELVKFDTVTKTYNTNGAIHTDAKVLGYHIVNTGSCIVWVNNLPLYPSGVLDTMYSGYKDASLYNLRFEVGGINPEVTVITFNQKQ
ncbi:MAG: hypothetical protein H3C45_04340 [Bacteroidia bacterium]|nr:hypothetical protein [Bacteroidia bacterium]MCC6690306.1 hypothetical protein [Bacteroidia bacterium]